MNRRLHCTHVVWACDWHENSVSYHPNIFLLHNAQVPRTSIFPLTSIAFEERKRQLQLYQMVHMIRRTECGHVATVPGILAPVSRTYPPSGIYCCIHRYNTTAVVQQRRQYHDTAVVPGYHGRYLWCRCVCSSHQTSNRFFYPSTSSIDIQRPCRPLRPIIERYKPMLSS